MLGQAGDTAAFQCSVQEHFIAHHVGQHSIVVSVVGQYVQQDAEVTGIKIKVGKRTLIFQIFF